MSNELLVMDRECSEDISDVEFALSTFTTIPSIFAPSRLPGAVTKSPT